MTKAEIEAVRSAVVPNMRNQMSVTNLDSTRLHVPGTGNSPVQIALLLGGLVGQTEEMRDARSAVSKIRRVEIPRNIIHQLPAQSALCLLRHFQ